MSFSMFRLCIVAAVAAPAVGSAGGFRGQAAEFQELAELAAGKLEVGEVRAKIQEMLDDILSVGSASIHGNSDVQRVEKLISTTFQAMPQTSAGRLGPQSVRHVVHSYFVKQHGWYLVGFTAGSDGANITASLEASIRAKVPALLEAVMEAHEHGRGLTLTEVAGMVTALERLIFDESVQYLQWAYMMNDVDDSRDISDHKAKEVLLSYLLLFKRRRKQVNAINNPAGHAEWKRQKREKGELAQDEEFVRDILGNFDFGRDGSVNPFASKSYSFRTLAQVVDRMTEQFGSWQDGGCKQLRNAMESLDTAGTGRVPLQQFWDLKRISRFVLAENETELRQIGALDESVTGRPTVRIPNYVVADGNCQHFSEYFSSCCLNTCDSIMSELEGVFKAPTAEPERLLAAVANLSAAADEDLDITASPVVGAAGGHMRQSLHAIAKRHGGKVPLQGRNFATWLHFAFPRDCPLPVKQADAVEVSVAAMKDIAPQEWASDMEYHMPVESAWAEEDDVPVLQDLEILGQSQTSFLQFRTLLRFVAMAGAVAAMVSIGMQQFRSIGSALQINAGRSKKDDDFMLPLRF